MPSSRSSLQPRRLSITRQRSSVSAFFMVQCSQCGPASRLDSSCCGCSLSTKRSMTTVTTWRRSLYPKRRAYSTVSRSIRNRASLSSPRRSCLRCGHLPSLSSSWGMCTCATAPPSLPRGQRNSARCVSGGSTFSSSLRVSPRCARRQPPRPTSSPSSAIRPRSGRGGCRSCSSSTTISPKPRSTTRSACTSPPTSFSPASATSPTTTLSRTSPSCALHR
mmetsp:Transcript_28972/g.62315  ORF Transcript_28972/g.62315 Transcript_28972/m.62315 type:complete len:220 (+) Transcript_28972:190-849(+)